MEHRLIRQDPIQPSAIEHKCEELFVGDKLEQKYNYIIYHFDYNGTYFWARTYLHDVETVSLHGPFESRATMKPTNGSLDVAVLVYLKRRFRNVQTLQNDGYAPI
jgi:hypothetical protein